MKRTVITILVMLAVVASADTRHFWRVASPDHEQTFTYGTETNRIWAERGRDRHLVLLLDFTNDPYVDRAEPEAVRQFHLCLSHVGQRCPHLLLHDSAGPFRSGCGEARRFSWHRRDQATSQCRANRQQASRLYYAGACYQEAFDFGGPGRSPHIMGYI